MLSPVQIEGFKRIREITYRRKNHPLKFYIPNQPQFDLIQAVSQRTKTKWDTFFLSCGNRTGKTYATCSIVAAIATEFRGGVFCNMPKWEFPKNIWIVANAEGLKQNLIPKLKYWLGPEKDTNYIVSKDGKPYESHFYFPDTGFNIYVLTYEQDPKVFESTDVGCILFDEPPPEDIFRATIRRGFQGCLTIISATPLSGAGYMEETVVEPARAGESYHRKACCYENSYISNEDDAIAHQKLLDKYKNTEHGDRYLDAITKTRPWTEKELLEAYPDKFDSVKYMIGQRKGSLRLEHVAKTVAKLRPDEITAGVFGDFTHKSGVVFKEYSRNKSVIQPIRPKGHQDMYYICKSPGDYRYIMALDPHDRRPCFAAWYAVDKWGKMYQFDEYPRRHGDVLLGSRYHDVQNYGGRMEDAVAQWVKQEREDHGFLRPDQLIRRIDPIFQGRNVKINTPDEGTVKELIEDESRALGWPMYFDLSVKEVNIGIEKCRALLKLDTYGDPSFYVYEHCENSNYAYSNWSYKEIRGVAAQDKYKSEDFKEIHSDPNACWRYASVTPPPREESDRPPPIDPFNL